MADRPRTGTTVTTNTNTHAAETSSAAVHAPCCKETITGRALAASSASCQPLTPKNQPIRSRL